MSPARSSPPKADLYAFVTLVTSDSYLPGALVAVHSLYDVEKSPEVPFETVCLVTPATVSVETIRALRQSFSLVVGVEGIRTNSSKELNLLGRQDLGYALTKLHLWRLVQFRKVIFLDADVLIIRPLSHLFKLDAQFAAAPDQGWPDCFNTGVIVCTPDAKTFDAILDLNAKGGSWDGADQGLLNDFYEDRWHRLSFTYNTTPSAYYQFKPAYRRHGDRISVVHFIGLDKPWHRLNRGRSVPSSSEQAANDYFGLLDKWFDVYERHFGQVSTAAVQQVARPQSSTSAFVVPTLQASWDVHSGRQLAYRAPSPEDLKTMFGGAARNIGSTLAARNLPEGLYASMPLTGRPDLLTELTPPKAPSPPPREPVPTQTQQHKSPSPPPSDVWDATRHAPPSSTAGQAGEMRGGFPEHYENVWDPGHKPGGFFQTPRYAPLPENVKGWYQSGPSDPSAVKPVFPWEQSGSSHRATRVFPVEPPRPRPAPPSSQARSASPSTSGRQTSPSKSGSYSYANAWDSIGGIRRYADSLRPASKPAAPPSQPHSRESSAGGSRERRPTSPPSASSSHKPHGSRRTSQDLNDLMTSNRSSSRRGQPVSGDAGDLSSHDGDDEDDYETDDAGVVKVKEPRKPRRPSAPQPLPGPSRPPTLRPHIRRNEGSLGSATRLPTIGGLAAVVDASAAVPNDRAAASPLTAADVKKTKDLSARRSATASADKAGPTPATEGPRQPASRYFDPATSSDIIRQEGLESLQRFVRSMEQKGEAAAANHNHTKTRT